MADAVLITGAARRVGRLIAEDFASRGWFVWIHYHESRTEAEALAQTLGNARAIRADLRKPDEIDRMFAEIGKSPIPTVLVNNSSLFLRKGLLDTTPEEWDNVMDLGLRGIWYASLCFYRLPTVGERHIINVGDAFSEKWTKNHGAYSFQKSALKTLTRMLAEEMSPDVKVHLAEPGMLIRPEKDGMTFSPNQAAVESFLQDIRKCLSSPD